MFDQGPVFSKAVLQPPRIRKHQTNKTPEGRKRAPQLPQPSVTASRRYFNTNPNPYMSLDLMQIQIHPLMSVSEVPLRLPRGRRDSASGHRWPCALRPPYGGAALSKNCVKAFGFAALALRTHAGTPSCVQRVGPGARLRFAAAPFAPANSASSPRRSSMPSASLQSRGGQWASKI